MVGRGARILLSIGVAAAVVAIVFLIFSQFGFRGAIIAVAVIAAGLRLAAGFRGSGFGSDNQQARFDDQLAARRHRTADRRRRRRARRSGEARDDEDNAAS